MTRTICFALLTTIAASAVAGAPDPKSSKKQCIADNESAQALRDEHKLRRARELFLACAADACPAVIRKDCAASALDLEKRIPTLVIRAKDEAGADLVAVKVSIDDDVELTTLDGKSIAIDPGVHRVQLEAAGFPVKEQQLVVSEGDKDRTLLVTFARERPAPPPVKANPPAPPSPPARTVPTAAWLLGGAGVAALGVGGVLYGLGLSQRSREIDAGCATRDACDDAKSSIRTKLIVGDVLVGLGVVSVIGSVVWAYSATRAPAEGPKHALDVQPVKGGAVAIASFSF